MKHTCIRHPASHKLLIIRDWQLEFTRGNYCAAALLSVFEYWHNIKLEMADNGEAKDLWQYQKQEKLEADLLGLYGQKTIRKALKLLEQKKAITTKTAPRYDRTVRYLFQPEVCNSFIASRTRARAQQAVKLPDGNGKNAAWGNGKNAASCACASSNVSEIERSSSETRTRVRETDDDFRFASETEKKTSSLATKKNRSPKNNKAGRSLTREAFEAFCRQNAVSEAVAASCWASIEAGDVGKSKWRQYTVKSELNRRQLEQRRDARKHGPMGRVIDWRREHYFLRDHGDTDHVGEYEDCPCHPDARNRGAKR